jgi:predicted transcriptional regulator
MRIAVDINDAQARALDVLAQATKQSRAALIRGAIEDYLARHQTSSGDDAFGLWVGRNHDGVTYQDKLRGEW